MPRIEVNWYESSQKWCSRIRLRKRAFRATTSAATAVELTDASVVFDDIVFDKRIVAPAVDLESIGASCGFMGAGKSFVSKPSQLYNLEKYSDLSLPSSSRFPSSSDEEIWAPENVGEYPSVVVEN